MPRYAILCGSAPSGFTQKKINGMHDFLTSDAGGAWAEKEIVFFPNGVDDAMLSFVLERLKVDKAEQIFLYICTMSPVAEEVRHGEEKRNEHILLYIMPILKAVAEEDKSVWLGGYEVRKSLIKAFCADGRGQVIYDCGRVLERNEEIELKKKVFENKITSLSFEREGE